MNDRVREEPEFQTLGEAITTLHEIIPADIKNRYFVGSIWEDILRLKDSSLEEMVPTQLGHSVKAAIYLGAYLINIIVQSLFSECALQQMVDPKTRRLTPLLRKDRRTIEKIVIPTIIQFVEDRLHVDVHIDSEINQPHVTI